MPNEKLKKIVALARGGFGGEKETALRMVRKICQEEKLDFDEVMRGGPEKQEFSLSFKNKNEEQLCFNIVAKFAMTVMADVPFKKYPEKYKMYFETTQERFVDTKNAYDILIAEYRQAQNDLVLAMVIKNDLFYAGDDIPESLKGKNATPEQIAQVRRARNFLDGVEEHTFRKVLR